jgi:hypothetical protein
MTLLDKLNFVAFNPLANNNPFAVRRRKLIAKIDEQIQLANDKDYTPTQHKWVTDEQSVLGENFSGTLFFKSKKAYKLRD